MEGAGLFSQTCPFWPQSQAQGGFVALVSCAKTLESLPPKRGNNFFFLWELPGDIALYFCSAPLWAKQISVILWEEETSAVQSLPTPGLIPWLIFPGKEPGSAIPHLQWGQWLGTPLQEMLLPQRVGPYGKSNFQKILFFLLCPWLPGGCHIISCHPCGLYWFPAVETTFPLSLLFGIALPSKDFL